MAECCNDKCKQCRVCGDYCNFDVCTVCCPVDPDFNVCKACVNDGVRQYMRSGVQFCQSCKELYNPDKNGDHIRQSVEQMAPAAFGVKLTEREDLSFYERWKIRPLDVGKYCSRLCGRPLCARATSDVCPPCVEVSLMTVPDRIRERDTDVFTACALCDENTIYKDDNENDDDDIYWYPEHIASGECPLH